MDRKSRPDRHSPLETTQTSLYTFRNVFGNFSDYFGVPLSSGWEVRSALAMLNSVETLRILVFETASDKLIKKAESVRTM